MRSPRSRASTGRRLALAGSVTLALLAQSAPAATALPPDVPGRTPVAAKGPPVAHSAISAGTLKRALARQLRRAGGIGGAWVKDLATGKVIFR